MELQTVSAASAPYFPVWARAAVSTNQADPFCCSPAWQLSFHDAFSPKRRLLIEESADSVMVFAEEVCANGEICLTPVERHWFFGCPLLGSHAVEMLAASMDSIAQWYAPLFPKIIISGIRPQGQLQSLLPRVFGTGFGICRLAEGRQCAASLAGGLDGFLSRRSANHRHKLKKEYRQATERGIYFERVLPISPQEAATTYERIIAVEQASWKGIGRCGMAEPPARRFYDVLLRRLSASGQGRVIFAGQEGRDIGFILGGKAGNIYRGQQFSYAEDWKSFSIGNLMQMEQIRWLCEEGAERYDMGPIMGPRMAYKAHWTEQTMPLQIWLLERK